MPLLRGGGAWCWLAGRRSGSGGVGAAAGASSGSTVMQATPQSVAALAAHAPERRSPAAAWCWSAARRCRRPWASGCGRRAGVGGRTCTGRPRRRSCVAIGGRRGCGLAAGADRPAAARTPGCTCWTRGCGRCRWGWPASCTSRVRAGARLSGPAGADGGAVRGVPVRRLRRADVPHRATWCGGRADGRAGVRGPGR